MKVIRRGEALGEGEAGSENMFSGDVSMHSVHRIEEQAGISVVRFQRGARTHWHSHSGGQVLHVIEGSGQVQSWGEEVRDIAPGDFVVADPDEKHWHGAAEGADMAHISIAIGGVEWMEPVT